MTDQYWSPAKQDPTAIPFRNKFDQSRDPLTARNAIGAVDAAFVTDALAALPAPLITSVTAPLSVTGGALALDPSTLNANCGRLEYVSATALSFKPYNGDRIRIAGTTYSIPSGGIAGLTNSGLSAGAVYYVYAYNNSGTITGEFSATGHATSTTTGNVGTEIKSGDDTRTLIGMVRPNGSAQFQYNDNGRCVISWFNRRNLSLRATATSFGTASTTSVAIGVVAELCIWADEAVLLTHYVTGTNSAVAVDIMSIGMDGGTTSLVWEQLSNSFVGGDNHSMSATLGTNLAEGYHYLYGLARCNAGTFSGVTAMDGVTRG